MRLVTRDPDRERRCVPHGQATARVAHDERGVGAERHGAGVPLIGRVDRQLAIVVRVETDDVDAEVVDERDPRPRQPQR